MHAQKTQQSIHKAIANNAWLALYLNEVKTHGSEEDLKKYMKAWSAWEARDNIRRI